VPLSGVSDIMAEAGDKLSSYNEKIEVANRAAHDINNLLVGILGYASILLQDDLVPGDEGKKLVSNILDCTGKASQETQKILNDENFIGSGVTFSLTGFKENSLVAAGADRSKLEDRKSILIIDDEEVVRTVSEAILSRAGYEVFTAATGAEGIALFESNHNSVSCVMLDLSMPYMKGNLVYARLKAIDPTVRVFVMSGYSDRQVSEQFDQQGIEGFLQKPFSPEMLLGAVNSKQSEKA